VTSLPPGEPPPSPDVPMRELVAQLAVAAHAEEAVDTEAAPEDRAYEHALWQREITRLLAAIRRLENLPHPGEAPPVPRGDT
jgi:hypothetical protein